MENTVRAPNDKARRSQGPVSKADSRLELTPVAKHVIRTVESHALAAYDRKAGEQRVRGSLEDHDFSGARVEICEIPISEPIREGPLILPAESQIQRQLG